MRLEAVRSSTKQAVLAIVFAVFALSLGDALIKASAQSLPLWQMLVMRSALVIPLLWWLARRNNAQTLRISGWVILRSGCLAVMWICYYISLPLMPLSVAAATYYTAPLIIVALASLVARTWPKVPVLLAISVGFLGVVLVIQPDVTDFQVAAFLPLFSAWLYACAMVMTAAKCRKDDPFVLAMMLNIALVLAGLAIGWFAGRDGALVSSVWQPVDFPVAATVFALAMIMFIGSLGAAIAYQKGPPATVAAFDYSYLVFSIIWGAVFFDEFPGAVALIGIFLIVGAGLVAFSQD
ncbi:DMT family transporter [Pelagimonas varians]|uniref:EamA-like transporter family protein n=1 Tax=Pelagimonas varians TaxID=696760 RepID=A0A238L4E2_9RHOB|nr:DMT family transporter [Pelagimonas varians]PYG26509.1 hypothetical protein C8N36_12270 [Pelagimonas varians]SMX49691.1 EamA-like transporter family protein [Pelagimonas varians]